MFKTKDNKLLTTDKINDAQMLKNEQANCLWYGKYNTTIFQ